ncbi:type II toxin-antitoxin system VapB family antitoxin [Okeanomitos corallinicola TIOX110]|uniref:Type II toxin-antitoxin system VapB family antitoxin n=1 Tax=Okeanomitos corallinicola TIOX110 TaxID=3133117 RepID=A0ABZ2URB9_9CYAN
MITNLEIDEKLIKEALELSGYSDQNALIAEALKQYIKNRKHQEIIELFGTIEYEDDYNYKQQRYRK